MKEPVKIKENDLAEIKMLQSKFQEGLYELGSLGAEKIELDRLVTEFVDKEKRLKEKWISLQKMEQDLLDKIVKNYGTGNLNMADGTFTPTNE